MKCVIAVVVCSTLIAGCSDRVTAPSGLQPGGSQQDLGFPPPPPATGSDGGAGFSISTGGDAQVSGAATVDDAAPAAGSCTGQFADGSFTFSYKYFENGAQSNEFLHILPILPAGKQINLSRHGTMFDAHGTLAGNNANLGDWTFTITGVIQGLFVTGQEGVTNPLVPGTFFYQLTGRLDSALGSCDATASFDGALNGISPRGQ